MKEIINKAVNICKALIYPVIFITGEIILTTIFTFFFNEGQLKEISVAYPHLNTNEQNQLLVEYMKTNEYTNELSQYINEHASWIIMISAIIFIPLFAHIYKKYHVKEDNKPNNQNIIILIITGITIAISLNIIIYLANLKWNFTDAYDSTNNNYIIALLATGILGPIIEELLFRGIVYEKLNKIWNNQFASILSVIIFAIFHNGISQIIYASIIGTLLIIVYKKYGIIGSSIVHISANSVIALAIISIISLPKIWMYLILIVTLVIFSISIYKIQNSTTD